MRSTKFRLSSLGTRPSDRMNMRRTPTYHLQSSYSAMMPDYGPLTKLRKSGYGPVLVATLHEQSLQRWLRRRRRQNAPP